MQPVLQYISSIPSVRQAGYATAATTVWLGRGGRQVKRDALQAQRHPGHPRIPQFQPNNWRKAPNPKQTMEANEATRRRP